MSVVVVVPVEVLPVLELVPLVDEPLAPVSSEVPDVPLLVELVPLELDAEPSSVDDDSAVSRNTTERRSISIRRNNARATCERSISTWPSADDDQCNCNAV